MQGTRGSPNQYRNSHCKDKTVSRSSYLYRGWKDCLYIEIRYRGVDPSHKSHNALDKHPTIHHFVTEMCTHVHISVTKRCIVYDTSVFVQHVYWLCRVSERLSYMKKGFNYLQSAIAMLRNGRKCKYILLCFLQWIQHKGWQDIVNTEPFKHKIVIVCANMLPWLLRSLMQHDGRSDEARGVTDIGWLVFIESGNGLEPDWNRAFDWTNTGWII